ncbi:unnamed protein product [Aphis gossypii]|uniref:Uncharacterized protein n=1 Tax=Aphis gossypii TaxID=80765 RepID=A0A9P0J6L7_APHGO|nr:unnamed protein product [Aphis gossypii]
MGIWYRTFSPIHSPASPSLPRSSQNPFRSLSPIQSEPSSPDIFMDTTPRPLVLRVRNDLFPEVETQSTISPSMLNLPLLRPPREHNLIPDTLQRTMSPTPNESDNGYDIQLIELMNAFENNWGQDGYDEEMNRHMDAYEGSKKQM